MPEVTGTRDVRIETERDVADARREVRALAEKARLDAFATAAITTAASELAQNVWTHARGGRVTLEELRDDQGRLGLRLHFADDGPGIADLERALAGGYSTVRSLGLGLSGSRRLADEFKIDSAPGRGTRVTVTKWARF